MSEVKLVVHAGPHDRLQCPVTTHLPLTGSAAPGGVTITTSDGAALPAQICSPHALSVSPQPANCAQVVFLLPALAAGQTLDLIAEFTDTLAPSAVTVSDDGAGAVSVSVGGEPLTTYHYLHNPARPCFFPLLGPGGVPVTRSWPIAADVPDEPQDHPHHRSLWVAHGDINGSDNWSEMEGHAFQLHREIIETTSGPVFGSFAARNDWTDRDQRKILEERRVFTAYAVADDARLFDLDICFTATERDLRFGDTKEGGIIAMRVASAMDGDHGGRIRNAYGAVGEEECWGRRAPWCDYTGDIAGQRLGIAIFDHPHSFRHPTYWHVRDYGMYTANPFGWHDFHGDPAADGSHFLPRGASLYFHYRVYLHRGDTTDAAVSARYHDYAAPPRVEVAA